MSDAKYSIKLATGDVVTGPIQGCGGTIPSGQAKRVQLQIDRANEGEPLGIYEPKPGCASMLVPVTVTEDNKHRMEYGRVSIDLRGATLIGEAK